MRPEIAQTIIALRAEELQAAAAAGLARQRRADWAAGERPRPGSGSGAAVNGQNGALRPHPWVV